jgi:hypothetical protein
MKVKIVTSFAGPISHSKDEIVEVTPDIRPLADQWLRLGYAILIEDEPKAEASRKSRSTAQP